MTMTRSIRRVSMRAPRRSLRVVALCLLAALTAGLLAIFAGGRVLAAAKGTNPAPACSTAMLSLTHAGMSYGTFRYVDIYALTNTSQAACTLQGYPQVAVRTASGAAVQSVKVTDATDTEAYSVASATQITLQPGDAAALYVGSVGNPGASQPCDPSARAMGFIDVTPPGDTVALSVPVPVNTGCSTVAPLYVSPILSSSALPGTGTTTDTTTTTATTTTATTTSATTTTSTAPASTDTIPTTTASTTTPSSTAESTATTSPTPPATG